MSSVDTTQVAGLLDGLASGSVEIVDLTQPLSETTPVIKLPAPFANTPGLSRTQISRYDDRGPAWAWYTLTVGEHVGTHLDAPIHWVTGKDGADVASIAPPSLIGPACVIDRTAQTESDAGYLLTIADLEAWEAEHGRIPDRAWVLLRTGWGARPRRGDVSERRRARSADAGSRRACVALAGPRAADLGLRHRDGWDRRGLRGRL